MTATPARLPARLVLITSLVIALVATALTFSTPAHAQKIRPRFFGMHDSQVASGSVTELPVGAVRLWDSGTSWRQIEFARGRFDWSNLDRAVETARAAGKRPLVVLGQTPRFHAKKRNAAGAYGRGATSMPKMRPWKRYVRKVARRYHRTVDYQVWNEPNVINYWHGSPQQMAKLTQTASQQIQRVAGKRATVVGPSFPLRLGGQKRWFRRYYHARLGGRSLGRFLDVVAVNLYPREHQGPEASMQLLRYAKRALPRFARRKPMWNTEINYGLRGGPTAKRIRPAKQAAFVARTLVLNAASPIRRTYWYSWGVGPIANTHLVQDDRATLTRAGRAWEEVRSWLVRTRATNCHVAHHGRLRGVYTCKVRAGRHTVRRIYWEPSGHPKRIRTHRTTRKWTNLAGHTTERRGRHRLKVTKLPIMVTSRR